MVNYVEKAQLPLLIFIQRIFSHVNKELSNLVSRKQSGSVHYILEF